MPVQLAVMKADMPAATRHHHLYPGLWICLQICLFWRAGGAGLVQRRLAGHPWIIRPLQQQHRNGRILQPVMHAGACIIGGTVRIAGKARCHQIIKIAHAFCCHGGAVQGRVQVRHSVGNLLQP